MKNIFVVFLLALLIRFCYIYFFVELEFLKLEDQGLYIQLGELFHLDGVFQFGSDRMPGYPLFLSTIYSLFGVNQWAVIIIQSVVDSVSCVLIGLLVASVLSQGFMLGGLLAALNLNMMVLSSMVLTDSLFLLFWILFLLFFVKFLYEHKDIWLFLAVFLLVIATMVRPVSYYLIFVLLFSLVIYWLYQKVFLLKVVTRFFISSLIVSLVLGGIQYRNYKEHGSFALTSQGGTHLQNWVVPATYQYSGLGSYQQGQELVQEILHNTLRDDNLTELPQNPFAGSQYQTKVAKIAFAELGFFNVLKAWVVGSGINLFAPSVLYAPALRAMPHPSFYETKGNGAIEKIWNYLNNASGALYITFIMVGLAFSFLFAMLSLLGCYKMMLAVHKANYDARLRSPLYFFVIFIGYFLAITGPIIGVKYRLPIEPIMTVFVVYALQKTLLLRKSISS